MALDDEEAEEERRAERARRRLRWAGVLLLLAAVFGIAIGRWFRDDRGAANSDANDIPAVDGRILDSGTVMPRKKPLTVFERSQVFASPSGTYEVCVASQGSSPGNGLSQAIVSEPQGGSGLIAFYSPRVSMGFVWTSEDELIVRYPRELAAPRIDATNTSFGFGGKGKVTYEAVPQSDIAPLHWTREGEQSTVTEKRLERGVLLTFERDGRREYSYSYYDVREPDPSTEALQAQGFQGGGYSWAGIVHGLVALRAPNLREELDIDPESDGLAVRSANRAALVTVAQLVVAAKRDQTLLAEAIERARRDDEME